MNPCMHSQLIFDKRANNTQILGERIVFFINSVGKTDNHMQKNEIRPLSYTTHKSLLQMS